MPRADQDAVNRRGYADARCRMAGYHDDRAALDAVVTEKVIGRERAEKHWRIGAYCRREGERCACDRCREMPMWQRLGESEPVPSPLPVGTVDEPPGSAYGMPIPGARPMTLADLMGQMNKGAA